MAKQSLSVNVIDRADGMPAQLLPNGNWGQWSLELNKYVDTGLQAYPEDDANVIKYYKLTNTSTTPTPPKNADGWESLRALNKALKDDGWSEDPLDVSEERRYQWAAIYLKRNVPVGDKGKGTITFVPRYTYRVVGLYNNYAASPTISYDSAKRIITITDPKGGKVAVKIPTPEAVDSLTTLVGALKRQVDKAVYSYEGAGEPTMDGQIVQGWLEGEGGKPVTDDKVKADIFATHVGDAYFDKSSNLAYRFALKTGGDGTKPGDYRWEVVKDSALSSAIARIAEIEGDTVKVWTETPTKGDRYKPGDILLYREGDKWRYKTCIAASTPPDYEYKETDWVEPYATLKEVEDLRKTLISLAGDLTAAKDNIKDLKAATDNIKGEWIQSIKDRIIDEQERKRLKALSDRIDEEQAQLQSNVDYITSSPYLLKDGKEAEKLRTAASAVLAKGDGAIDKLQTAIATAIDDSLISEEEVLAVDGAFSAYQHARAVLLTAITTAKAEIDKQLSEEASRDAINFDAGRLLTKDPTFAESGCLVSYNNSPERGSIEVAWIDRPEDCPSTSPKAVRYRYVSGDPSPDDGGFCNRYASRANAVFIHRIIAKVPKGVRLNKYCNPIGDGGTQKWISSNLGTGRYEEYIYVIRCGGEGKFASFGHVAFERYGSDAPTGPYEVIIAYSGIYDMTDAPTIYKDLEALDAYAKEARKIADAAKQRAEDTYTKAQADGVITEAERRAIDKADEAYRNAVKAAKELDEEVKKIRQPRILPNGNWALWDETQKKLVDSGRSSAGDDGHSPKVVNGIWYEWDGSKYTSTGIKAQGEDALSVQLLRQGSFRTSFFLIGPSGELLDTPQVIKTVEGGEDGKVVVRAIIRKGVRDVTDSAISKGANPIWYLNGVRIASGSAVLKLGVGDHVDGKTDAITFEYDDSKASEW